MLLDLLGVKVGDEGLTGEIAKLAKFEATCMDPLQILRAAPFLDAGRRDRVYRGANSATVIELAPRDGYLTDRVAKLRELAQFALLNGGKLVRMSQEPKAGGFGNIRCPHSRNQSKGLMPEANGSTRNVWMS